MLYGTYRNWRHLHTSVMPALNPETLSKNARQYLTDAEAANTYVRGEIPVPCNGTQLPALILSTPYFRDGDPDGTDDTKGHRRMRKAIQAEPLGRTVTPHTTYGQYMRIIASPVVSVSRGNCGEMCAAAYKWLTDMGHAGEIATVSCWLEKDGCGLNNHTFLVIGLAKDADAKDPATWGPDCVICDPWLDVCACNVVFWMLVRKMKDTKLTPVGISQPLQSLAANGLM